MLSKVQALGSTPGPPLPQPLAPVPWPTNLCREGNLSFVSQGPREERRPNPPEVEVRGGTEVQEVGRCLLGPTIRHERFGASEKARR